MTRKGIIKKKGDWHGVAVTVSDIHDCPSYELLNGDSITIVITENGYILAVKDSEVYWGK